MADITLPTDLLVEIVRQGGLVAVAFLGAVSAALGVVGRMWWERRRGAPQTRADGERQTTGLHHEIAGILKEQRALYEGVIAEQRQLHEERTERIRELTVELHEVREELRHLYRYLEAQGIPIPPR